ncbi:MAG: hypothetical protein LUD29_03335 [Clostridia bacterium]|nr:hypothetical protein [Clostridia bacterium]
MGKSLLKTKIVCVAAAAVMCAGVVCASACSVRNKIKLDEDPGTSVYSNGGFAVYTDDYIYYMNGVENTGVDNSYGTPEKGAIMRISRKNLAERNYSDVETVVPQVAYTGDYGAGLYIYDGYIYYSTPSTDRNSDGEILNTRLDFKRTKLDGSESMTGHYYQALDNEMQFRYVQPEGPGGDVYLMYVAEEDFYDLGSETLNIHSYNTTKDVDTVLAYNIDSYVFDTADPEDPVIYYTMSVYDDLGSDTEVAQNYNQIYRATADMTEAKEYDFSYIDTEADDYNEDDPIYVNCGDLIFDGIGLLSSHISPTQFNFYGEDPDAYKEDSDRYITDNSDYTYELVKFENGLLYYNRYSAINSQEVMFTLEDVTFESDDVEGAWDAIEGNPNVNDAFFTKGDVAEAYKFLSFTNSEGQDLAVAIGADNSKLLFTPVEDGEMKTDKEYFVADDEGEGDPLFQFTDGDYLYYSFEGDNDAMLYRVNYKGTSDEYKYLATGKDGNGDYDCVKIFDVEFHDTNAWFYPEIIDGQVIFASEVSYMSDYEYIEVCDLRKDDCTAYENLKEENLMNNDDIRAKNDLFDDVIDTIEDIDEDDYENLQGALKYLFYTGDADYMEELVDHWVTYEGKKETYQYSKESKEIFYNFYNTEDTVGDAADWADWFTKYGEYSKEVNGKTVYCNNINYYRSLLGSMAEDDEEDYLDSMRGEFMASDTEDNRTWWERISTASKVWFIVGMCLCGLVVLAGIAIAVYFIIKHYKKKAAEKEAKEVRRGKASKVDVSDDKSVNVYEQDSGEPEEEKEAEPSENAGTEETDESINVSNPPEDDEERKE